ncbi:MAG: alpha-amylase family glycosyl hydrolase [Geobacteraceae bacterium]|nr:alpha-amylase family glycosyl hydrolase [Geobacteraceae bacterium]
MKKINSQDTYFSYEIQISGRMWQVMGLSKVMEDLATQPAPPAILFYRQLADRLNRFTARESSPARSGELRLFALMSKIFRYLFTCYLDDQYPHLEEKILTAGNLDFTRGPLAGVIHHFIGLYPPNDPIGKQAVTPKKYLARDTSRFTRRRHILRETLLLRLFMENPALRAYRPLFDASYLAAISPYGTVTSILDRELEKAPPCAPFKLPILKLLRAPQKACPDSLARQLEFIRKNWAELLPPDVLSEIISAFDTISEEERARWDGPGPPLVLEFSHKQEKHAPSPLEEYPEPESFSQDREWMPNVVLIAKMAYVWMDQLSRKYGWPITRLDEIPDSELDTLASWGFTGLWLIGIWERSPASRKIKQFCGNPEAIASAYSLYDYVIAEDLGGNSAMENLRHRAALRGIRLASDMVPNHTGIDSRWTHEHPDWFVQLDYPPYPGYRFEGPDLSSTQDICLRIEDGYWSKTDAAVVFQHVDNRTGRVRYIYHGNDGTSTPWNDTAQLNYLLPEVRETVIQTILHVARNFPIIRFDAAMTLAKKHFQRLWFPQTGLGGGIPSRAEHALSRARFDELFPKEFWREVVDRVSIEAPDTLLLAEAFWLMEGYFVRTLGMHRVYNSAFMNMLKLEENAKYRQTIKNVLEFNPEILQRFVNFMNNPDEKTAVEQFGKEGKYFGAAVLLVTMPGLPMFGHGQIEGFTEKYGMEYRRAYWTEEIDRHLVEMHEQQIFPLMKKRRLFSGAANFVLYDFLSGDAVDENIFAYSNSCENERALIVYHNRFATSSGWIRTSCSRAVKGASGESRQLQTTLGEALGINPDGRYYYRFRDSASGLEYLRHGKELAEKGLFLKLNAFECHAFLDFREIRDDDYGTWGKLCLELADRPTASLDEDLRQIQFSGARMSLSALFLSLPDLLPALSDPEAPETKHKEAEHALKLKLEDFLFALQSEGSLHLDRPTLIQGILRNLSALIAACRMKSRKKGWKETRENLSAILATGKDYDNGTLALLYLTFQHLSDSLGEHFREHPEKVLVEFALAKTLASCFQQVSVSKLGDQIPPVDNGEDLLLRIMLVHNSFFLNQMETETADARMEQLFADNGIREFLHVHLSEGIEWFNRERFEELLKALYLTGLCSLVTENTVSAEMISETLRIHKEVREYSDRAEKSGYRTLIFLHAIE